MLDDALDEIALNGQAALSLRRIATRIGVTPTAIQYHFGNRRGVLTAIAVEGFETLAAAVRDVRVSGESFLESGVAYVRFALEHPAHFAVMFEPKLLDENDPRLAIASEAASRELHGGVQALSESGRIADPAAGIIAAWSLVHGFATLALTGAIDRSRICDVDDDDLLGLVRRAASLLYLPPPASDH